MTNNKHFTPKRVDKQINQALETDQEHLAPDTDEYLLHLLDKHFQPGDEYDLALKRVEQRLTQFQGEEAASNDKQPQLQPLLPAQLYPGQFQTARANETRRFIQLVSLLAAAALCVLLVGGALALLSQAHSTSRCNSCLGS